jgi:hypothetical protein
MLDRQWSSLWAHAFFYMSPQQGDLHAIGHYPFRFLSPSHTRALLLYGIIDYSASSLTYLALLVILEEHRNGLGKVIFLLSLENKDITDWKTNCVPEKVSNEV